MKGFAGGTNGGSSRRRANTCCTAASAATAAAAATHPTAGTAVGCWIRCCLDISCVQLGAGPQHAMPGWLNVDGSMSQDNQKPADGKQLYVSFSGSKVPFT